MPSRHLAGIFPFEIRAWDIGSNDQEEIATGFKVKKKNIRKAISAHKGISVYRDNVLVLPKTDGSRDWLGLDLRRISKVGKRLSTNQIVGYVRITAADNPRIQDTSDRERLASCMEVAEFKEILRTIVRLLEQRRFEDRDTVPLALEKPMRDLFAEISADDLLENVSSLAERGAKASEALPLVTAFKHSLDTTRKTIERRSVYYSRLATVGSIAHMLVHEVRGRTTVFGSFIKFVREKFLPNADPAVAVEVEHATDATDSLDRLADTFVPLASRRFRRRLRQEVLEDRINKCLALMRDDIKAHQVECSVPESTTPVSVDPAELDTILLNLISNSLYWLREVPEGQRKLDFLIVPVPRRKTRYCPRSRHGPRHIARRSA